MRYSSAPVQTYEPVLNRRLSKALDSIHSASRGNENEIQRISTLISESQLAKQLNSSAQRERTKAKPVKPLSLKEKRREKVRAFEKMTARRHPDATPILSRPRPVVNGKRRVPVLVNARGVPFLRTKKPQPMNLSGVIRSKLDNRWKRVERRERLTDDSMLAEYEDLWDKLTIGREDVTWAKEVYDALKEVNTRIKESDVKNKQLADDMWNVVLAEHELAEEERQRSTEK